MGSEEKKEARERFLLERFLESQGVIPASIEKLRAPEPDFSIEVDGRKIGVELTEIFALSPKSGVPLSSRDLPQAIESRSDLIVSKARETYFQRNNPPVLATIVFSNLDTSAKKEQIQEIALSLASEVADMASKTPQTADRRPDDFTDVGNPLRESVALIHICRVPELRFARWTVPKVGLVHKLTARHLQDRIAAKEEKMKHYTRDRDEVWLLMAADTRSTSQKFFHPLDFPPEAISSPFSRTFYFCYGADQPVVEFC
jgi:hypothetical protein